MCKRLTGWTHPIERPREVAKEEGSVGIRWYYFLVVHSYYIRMS